MSVGYVLIEVYEICLSRVTDHSLMLHQNLQGTDYWHGGRALYSKSGCEDLQKVSGPYIQARED